jgi:hypothetical protein
MTSARAETTLLRNHAAALTRFTSAYTERLQSTCAASEDTGSLPLPARRGPPVLQAGFGSNGSPPRERRGRTRRLRPQAPPRFTSAQAERTRPSRSADDPPSVHLRTSGEDRSAVDRSRGHGGSPPRERRGPHGGRLDRPGRRFTSARAERTLRRGFGHGVMPVHLRASGEDERPAPLDPGTHGSPPRERRGPRWAATRSLPPRFTSARAERALPDLRR